jgi:hypothetical protein
MRTSFIERSIVGEPICLRWKIAPRSVAVAGGDDGFKELDAARPVLHIWIVEHAECNAGSTTPSIYRYGEFRVEIGPRLKPTFWMSARGARKAKRRRGNFGANASTDRSYRFTKDCVF